MSIAVSTVIAPSRLLRGAVASCAAVHLGAGLLLLLSAFAPALSGVLGPACLAAAAVLARRALAPPANWRRIDISGLGEIRLTVQGYQGAPGAPGGPLILLPGSTLWPSLLLLRLGGATVTVLPVLADSVAPGSFRPLAAALRDIAVRNKKFSKTNEID